MVDVDDHPSENLLEKFEECFAFIDGDVADSGQSKNTNTGYDKARPPPQSSQQVQTRVVLVHCASGVSRSVAVCCAYLMNRDKIPYELALSHIKQIRPLANPNFGFQRQLQLFENCGHDLPKALAAYQELEANESATDAVRRGREQANLFHSTVDQLEETIVAMDAADLLKRQGSIIMKISMLQNRIDNFCTDVVGSPLVTSRPK